MSSNHDNRDLDEEGRRHLQEGIKKNLGALKNGAIGATVPALLGSIKTWLDSEDSADVRDLTKFVDQSTGGMLTVGGTLALRAIGNIMNGKRADGTPK